MRVYTFNYIKIDKRKRWKRENLVNEIFIPFNKLEELTQCLKLENEYFVETKISFTIFIRPIYVK